MPRYRSTGRIRREVRRFLAPQLAEIDGLVRRLLNLPAEGNAWRGKRKDERK